MSVREVLKDESTRQAVILVFGVVGAVVTVYAIRYAQDESLQRETKMRTALKVKRYAQKRADYWQKLADEAATEYNREKL